MNTLSQLQSSLSQDNNSGDLQKVAVLDRRSFYRVEKDHKCIMKNENCFMID